MKPIATVLSRLKQKNILLLWIGSVLINIKSIFCDYDVDLAYAMVTSFRNIGGDRMFLQMWEPHQMSSFLCTALMYLFHTVTGSWEYAALFLQICGVLIYALASLFLFRVLREYLPEHLTHYICILFFTLRPKQLVFPEFSNMLLLFTVLEFLFLIRFFQKGKRSDLILAALMNSLSVLSYPTAVLLFPVSAGLILYYSAKKLRSVLIYTGICLLSGIGYLTFFICRIGPEALFGAIGNILASDSSHLHGKLSPYAYWCETLHCLLIFLSCLALCFLLGRCRILSTLKQKLTFMAASFFLTNLAFCIYNEAIGKGWTKMWSYTASFCILPLLIFGILTLSGCSANERQLFITGTALSAGMFFCVLVLTNLSFITVVNYMILSAMVSLIPLYRALNEASPESTPVTACAPLITICLFLILHRGLLIQDFSIGSSMITGINNIIRQGPTKGIFCSYMQSYMTGCNYEDWQTFVHEDDCLLIVGGHIDTTMYMYRDSIVSHYSTICTPTYDETLLKYWEKFPEKRPTVVAVDCWYGNLNYPEDSWIIKWLEENYPVRADGRYYAFFRRQ